MDNQQTRSSRLWLILSTPPFLFLIGIVVASVYFGIINQGNAQKIANAVPQSTPYILLGVQIALLLFFWWRMRTEKLTLRDIGWKIQPGKKLWLEVLIGTGAGLCLGILYVYVFSPLLITIQRVVGDYIPPGQILPDMGMALLPFFFADVIMAPFVEENFYRGYAFTRLRQRFNVPVAVVLSCLFFGLLH